MDINKVGNFLLLFYIRRKENELSRIRKQNIELGGRKRKCQ